MVNSRKIRGRMVELGVTQKKLAEIIGRSQTTVSQKLSGVRPMWLDEAESIAEALSIPNSEFGCYFFNSEIA